MRLNILKNRSSPGVLKTIREKIFSFVITDIRKAGLTGKIIPEMIVIGCALCSIIGLFIGVLLNNSAVSLILSISFFVLPFLWLKQQIKKRDILIKELSPICIHIFVTAFQLGVTVKSLRTAIEQIPEPLKKHFDKVVAELLAGKSEEEIINDFSNNIGNRYLQFALKNILISLKQGNDVIPILLNLMKTVSHEKILIAKKKKATSEANYMITVSIGIMFLIIGIFGVFNPHFLETYVTTSAGKMAVTIFTLVILICLYNFQKTKSMEIE